MDPYEELMSILGETPSSEPADNADLIQTALKSSFSQAELERACQLVLSDDLEDRWLITLLRRETYGSQPGDNHE